MERGLSTYLFSNQRLNTVTLDRIWNAGIPLVEFFCARQHIDWRNRAQIAELGHWFRDSRLKLHAIHAPLYNDEAGGRSGPNSVINITEPVKSKRISMVDEVKLAIEIAEVIPCRYLIQHLGVSGEEYDERKLDAAFDSLDEISLFARQRGVEVLLENIPNGMSSAERLVNFLAVTHLRVGFCLDTGHAHMHEGVSNAFDTLKDRLYSTHIHDNDGSDDLHLYPKLAGGTINWRRAMHRFRSAPGQFPLVLELRDTPEFQPPLEYVKQVFDRLERDLQSEEREES